MTEAPDIMVNCPECGKPAHYHPSNPDRPFCSTRCRLIDLGEWADEGHRIPGDPVPPDSDQELH
jgi:uncharacterized protein